MRAMQPGVVAGVQIATGGPEQDGSGLHFGLVENPKDQSLAEVADEIGRALDRTDVPIRVEVSGAVVPITG